MSEHELVQAALEVLRAEGMVDAVEVPLKHGPDALYTVCVCLGQSRCPRLYLFPISRTRIFVVWEGFKGILGILLVTRVIGTIWGDVGTDVGISCGSIVRPSARCGFFPHINYCEAAHDPQCDSHKRCQHH